MTDHYYLELKTKKLRNLGPPPPSMLKLPPGTSRRLRGPGRPALHRARVVAHVKAVWPAECAELGDPAVADTVSGLIQRAAAPRPCQRVGSGPLVDLAFILAGNFDTNPLAAWTRPISHGSKAGSVREAGPALPRMEEEFALIEKRKGRKSMTTIEKDRPLRQGTADVVKARATRRKPPSTPLPISAKQTLTKLHTVQPQPNKTRS